MQSVLGDIARYRRALEWALHMSFVNNKHARGLPDFDLPVRCVLELSLRRTWGMPLLPADRNWDDIGRMYNDRVIRRHAADRRLNRFTSLYMDDSQ